MAECRGCLSDGVHEVGALNARALLRRISCIALDLGEALRRRFGCLRALIVRKEHYVILAFCELRRQWSGTRMVMKWLCVHEGVVARRRLKSA